MPADDIDARCWLITHGAALAIYSHDGGARAPSLRRLPGLASDVSRIIGFTTGVSSMSTAGFSSRREPAHLIKMLLAYFYYTNTVPLRLQRCAAAARRARWPHFLPRQIGFDTLLLPATPPSHDANWYFSIFALAGASPISDAEFSAKRNSFSSAAPYIAVPSAAFIVSTNAIYRFFPACRA